MVIRRWDPLPPPRWGWVDRWGVGVLDGSWKDLKDIYVHYPLSGISHDCSRAFWVKCMGWQLFLPDVLRELRLWGTSASCPWGFVALILVVVSLLCWWCGFLCAALVFSHNCRRGLVYLARSLVVVVSPVAGAAPRDLRVRLSEYHRGS